MGRATDPTSASGSDRPTVLVTGASGLIGSRLVHALAPDHRVVAMVREHPGETHPASSVYVPVDLTSDESTNRVMRGLVDQCGEALASVVHLTAYYDFTGAPSPLCQEWACSGWARSQ
jgi:nucleoside-diphosphate-sugar epimerase